MRFFFNFVCKKLWPISPKTYWIWSKFSYAIWKQKKSMWLLKNRQYFLEKKDYWKRNIMHKVFFFFNFLVLGIWSMLPICCKKIPSFKFKNENLHFSPNFESLTSFSKILSFVPWISNFYFKFHFLFSNFDHLENFLILLSFFVHLFLKIAISFWFCGF